MLGLIFLRPGNRAKPKHVIQFIEQRRQRQVQQGVTYPDASPQESVKLCPRVRLLYAYSTCNLTGGRDGPPPSPRTRRRPITAAAVAVLDLKRRIL